MLATLVPLAVLILPFACAVGCAQAQDPPPATLAIADGRGSLRGVVRQNVTDCERDGPCYLVLQADTELRVYYHHGENPPCANERATRLGLTIAAGDTVEASGRYSSAGTIHIVDVCCPDCTLAINGRQ